jgi:taurine dioxygenase/alpha-ketoglutarate-dependent 2,4-dichlorophenoxyacetate dioxygenase
LYFTANAGNEVSGMSLEDGQAIHKKLVEHVSRPEFCYFHQWEKGDLVVWDNRTTLHKAETYDMSRYRRVFRRTTVAGNGPVVGPYSRPLIAKAVASK